LNKEFSLPIIAALLTIIGYSLNDTIVVYDRIRENIRGVKRHALGDIINASINQVLSRTLLTSLTTLLVVTALLFLGGAVIHDFAFALLVGVITGTYSSIFIASPTILVWEHIRPSKKKRK
jgi:preprotein translocase subunit SecF